MHSTSFLTVFIFIICSPIFANSDGRIQLVNGGYEGLVVAIKKDIKPENSQKIIDNLKKLLTLSSEFLYNATEGRAFFRNIILIVPESWPIDNAVEIPSCFNDAHIKVGSTDKVYGDEPYTLQPDDCGKPGKFIHLSEKYVSELYSKPDELNRPDKQLIHEWAHYRYGVFDEHGSDGSQDYPLFYMDNGMIHPTSCVSNVSGWAEKPNGQKCEIYPDGTIDYDCEFYADREAKIEASIMYSPNLPSVQSFCTHDSGSKQHNRIAPTPQNAKCDGKSVWEVMMENEDFKGKSVPPRPKTLQPEFIYRKYGSRYIGKYVMVLDISGSMKGPRMQSLNYAAKTLIKDIPLNNYMSIITFSSTARVEQNLTQITDDNVRQTLMKAVPNGVEGSTMIGLGLRKAIEVLKLSGKGVEGSTIFLVTDGGEDATPPQIKDVTPELVQAGVKVMCLAIGPNASEALENLTRLTGGKMNRVADGANADMKFETIFSSFVGCEDDDQSVAVFDKLIDIEEKLTDKEVVIKVDSELGKNNVITISLGVDFNQDKFNKLKITVIAPDGFNYTCGAHSDFIKDDTLKRCQLKLSLSKNGDFKVHINRNSDEPQIKVNIKMTSEARDPNDPPVTVNAWLSKIDIDHSKELPVIFVQIKKGNFPVINAEVYAIIDSEKGTHYRIKVKDSGKFDGIYSAKFTKADSNGRYSVSAEVTYTKDTRVVVSDRSFKPGTPKISNTTRTDKPKTNFNPDEFKFNPTKPVLLPKYENLTDFVRTKVAGSFKISNFTDKDVVPPEKVTDLKVAKVREDVHLIDLQWTAPGDDETEGTVTEIELRVSKNRDQLIGENAFENQPRVNNSMIVFGEFKPLKAGSKQEIGIKLPESFWKTNIDRTSGDIYFALRSIDSAGNKAKISNIANAHFGYDQIIQPRTPPTTPKPLLETIDDIVANNAEVTKTFPMPEDYGILTEWKLTTDEIENFNFTLKSPDNKIYNENSESFSKNIHSNIARFNFDDAIHGNWVLTIRYSEKVKEYNTIVKVHIISARRDHLFY